MGKILHSSSRSSGARAGIHADMPDHGMDPGSARMPSGMTKPRYLPPHVFAGSAVPSLFALIGAIRTRRLSLSDVAALDAVEGRSPFTRVQAGRV